MRRSWSWSVAAALTAAFVLLSAALAGPAGAETENGATAKTSAAARAGGPWTGTWEGAPQRPDRGPLKNVTVRLTVHVAIGGSAVRIRLDNTYGTKPLRIGAASIGIQAKGAAVRRGTLRPLTFNRGHARATIAPGGMTASDGVREAVRPNTNLAVSLYLPANTGPPTRHSVANQDSYISTAGNHAGDRAPRAFRTRTREWFFLNGVDVRHRGASAVVALGDSITDGAGSTLNRPDTYPQVLFHRLQAAGRPYSGLSVLNAGIGGNELLRTSTCCHASASGLARLARDVLGQPGAKDVIVLLGRDDIHGLYHSSAGAIIAGLKKLIRRAHARGVRVLGGTIMPSDDFVSWMNHDRDAVNHWIRTGGAFDGVVDFASAVAARGNPDKLNRAYDSGDGEHPNDAGYRAMARAVNLSRLLGHRRRR